MAKVFITDFAGIRITVAPGTSLILTEGIFRAGFIRTSCLTAVTFITFNHTKRNTSIGIGRTTILTVKEALARVKSVIGGNIFGTIATFTRSNGSLVA